VFPFCGRQLHKLVSIQGAEVLVSFLVLQISDMFFIFLMNFSEKSAGMTGQDSANSFNN